MTYAARRLPRFCLIRTVGSASEHMLSERAGSGVLMRTCSHLCVCDEASESTHVDHVLQTVGPHKVFPLIK